MTLTVEDGSIVSGANSYVSLTDARAYATARGETLPADDAACEVLLIKAMDNLESLRADYQGSKVDSGQALQWPRYPVYIDGFMIDSDFIPAELIAAQIQLAIDQNNGIDIAPSQKSGFVIRDKTGPLETEYSEKIGTGTMPTLTVFRNLIKPLLKNTISFFQRV